MTPKTFVFIGIPSWPWKKPLLSYALKHQNIVEVPVDGVCHECSRHLNLLKSFDLGVEDFKDSEYFQYQKQNGKNDEDIMLKIGGFRALYYAIRKDGCMVHPVVTDDGCRLDGSHRCAIATHLQKTPTKLNMVKYEDVFDKKQSKKIREDVAEYRRSVYGL